MGETVSFESMSNHALVGKEHALSMQVAVLLSVVDKLGECLATEHRFTGQEKAALDGGVTASVEATLIQACNRLDSLLANPKNWGTADQDALFRAITRTHEAQQAFLASQKLSADEVRRPSFQLRPSLMRAETGFAAVYGDITDPSGHIVGVGATPEAALLDFDAAFQRVPAQQIQVSNEKSKKKKS